MAKTQWVVLCADGRHSVLVRDREPARNEIARSRGMLGAAGQPSWLAVMKGAYYVPAAPDLRMVQPLGSDPGSWEEASAAFEVIRRATIWPSP